MATQCIPLDQITGLLPWEIPLLYSCDIWPTPHILNVLILGIFTKSPTFAFLMSGIWEIIEVLILIMFNNFSLFFVGPEENLAFENLGQTLISDWLIHGGIGTLLSWIFIRAFRFPAMLTIYDFWNRVYVFWYYLFGFILLLFGFFFLYGAEVNDFRLGVLLSFIIQGAFIVILLLTQPKETWSTFSRREIV